MSLPPATVRTDRLGREVNVPFGYTYRQGTNGKGIAVAPGSRTKEDRYGQLHEVPRGFVATDNPDGFISVHPQGELEEGAKSKAEPVKRLSQGETIQLMERLRRRILGD